MYIPKQGIRIREQSSTRSHGLIEISLANVDAERDDAHLVPSPVATPLYKRAAAVPLGLFVYLRLPCYLCRTVADSPRTYLGPVVDGDSSAIGDQIIEPFISGTCPQNTKVSSLPAVFEVDDWQKRL